MIFLTRLAACGLVALACAGIALTQEKTKDKPQSEEDGRLDRIIERWIEANETERDRVFREVARAGGDKSGDDFEQWFTRLGGDDDGWDRTRIQRKSVGEIFDRIAYQFEVRGPILKRDQFVHYAKLYWRKDKSRRWRDPPAFETWTEADKLFKHLDRDRNGYLSQAEMSPVLRADLKRWDRNGDGYISVDEYRAYFPQRLDRVFRAWQQKSEKPLPTLEIAVPQDEQPMVLRAAKLPTGLPAWFDQIDSDRDGQIALFEWRRAGWPVDEFEKLDLNNDGFLEPLEILRLVALTERDGSRPYAYLFQKRIGPPTK